MVTSLFAALTAIFSPPLILIAAALLLPSPEVVTDTLLLLVSPLAAFNPTDAGL